MPRPLRGKFRIALQTFRKLFLIGGEARANEVMRPREAKRLHLLHGLLRGPALFRHAVSRYQHPGAIVAQPAEIHTFVALEEDTYSVTVVGGLPLSGGLLGAVVTSSEHQRNCRLLGPAEAWANMRRAVIYGSVMGSFAVETFSIERLMTVTGAEIDQRMREMRRLVTFEERLPA